ncbi:3,4-dihydroxy-2-butanone-4-phosphate synthase [Myxococcota bacterium]|nr:3,4-dihydroxy-2-butanone-4-phosphate synthase [Myxococcota bacterium]
MPISIEDALQRLRQGRMLILVDDEDRENEGDVVAAASSITAEQIAFMARQARGLICAALAPEICDRLGFEPMTRQNTAPYGTAFTISVDAREGVRTGISASERAHTIRLMTDPAAGPRDFVSPGNVFPLRAVPGGVLVRTGQTEGSVDLCRMAGVGAAGVICEILKDDGTMMRMAELEKFGEAHDLPIVTVADIVSYRLRNETLIRPVASADLPTDFEDFRVHAFTTDFDGRAHLALALGDLSTPDPVLVRVHRANFPGDLFTFSKPPRGHPEVERGLKAIAAEGRGIFLYLNREETGEDLLRSLSRLVPCREPARQVEKAMGQDVQVNFRDFGVGAQILRHLGAQQIRVVTDHPKHFAAMAGFGLQIVEFVPMSEEAG